MLRGLSSYKSFSCRKKSHLDWEGYTDEERKRFLDDHMTARAKRFDAIVPLVRLQDEAMEIIARKLTVARKILSSPHLIYHMHGVSAPRGGVDAVSHQATSVPLPSALGDNALMVATAPPPAPSFHERILVFMGGSVPIPDDDNESDVSDDDEVVDTPRPSSWNWRFRGKSVQSTPRGPPGISESKGDVRRSMSSLASVDQATSAAACALLPAPDPRTEFEIALERRRLDTLILAYEALSEFHRVEKW